MIRMTAVVAMAPTATSAHTAPSINGVMLSGPVEAVDAVSCDMLLGVVVFSIIVGMRNSDVLSKVLDGLIASSTQIAPAVCSS